MNTTAQRVKALHTKSLLTVWLAADGSGSCGILAGNAKDMTGPVVIAETFAEIRCAGEGAKEESLANARRLVACWNRLDKFTTEQIEDFGYDFAETSKIQNDLWNMQNQRDALMVALEKVLSTHSAECKAELTLSTATENYSDHHPELDSYIEAAEASSKAEADARSAIAKVKGGAT